MAPPTSSSSLLCFAAVEGLAQLSDLILFCKDQPFCIKGYEVRADLSKQAKEVLAHNPDMQHKFKQATAQVMAKPQHPDLHLKFGRLAPGESANERDVFALARRAGLPEPRSVSVISPFTCFVRYNAPDHAQAFLNHYQQQPLYQHTRDAPSWALTCSYSEGRRQ